MKRKLEIIALLFCCCCLIACNAESNDNNNTNELTIKENADGSFMYMGNKIQNDGINRIPDYQYRIRVSN